ncbi:hypothetical protein [Tunicatimonas pelagia]|uniref:hypothetical protein n=1 Tax=Tunicatimonas pelagia TaxID=931531 RepID=UPI0026657B15|nr:hypothetical protein [Tunicatimonas pelagia]WKN43653.1 hypothetical protein P0M28_01550 [Tunicatimonas pelagia]
MKLCRNQAHLSETDAYLQFNGLELGATHREIVRQLGRPKFSWKNPLFRPHQVKVYRMNIHHIYCYATLHFINSRLFAVDTNFKKLSNDNTNRILDTLKSKYLNDNESDLFNGVIDDLGNTMLLEHNHYLSLKYVAGEMAFRRTLHNAVQRKEKSKASFEINLDTALAEYL